MAKAKKKTAKPVIHPLDRKAGLYLQDTPVKGRGVFCKTDISKGEVIEVTPALILNGTAVDHADKTILSNYTFRIGKVKKGLQPVKDPAAACSVVMGLQSFCNHDEKPNAEIVWEEIEGSVYYVLHATRKIPKNTEICTTYGRGWFKDRK